MMMLMLKCYERKTLFVRAAGEVSNDGATGPGFEPQLPMLASTKATPKMMLLKNTMLK
jgi:hypothetical protein